MLKSLFRVPPKVIIDTGPLMLFLAGNYDPVCIPKMKRIKYEGRICNEKHYEILKQYLNRTKERLITPGILSEVWNLIDNDISNKKDKENLFIDNIRYFKLINEIYVPKNEILSDDYLCWNTWNYGFTDASIILCAKNNSACVLTQDFPLYNVCRNLKIESNHLNSIFSLIDI
jgi:predicted nucleic acid-binding protein